MSVTDGFTKMGDIDAYPSGKVHTWTAPSENWRWGDSCALVVGMTHVCPGNYFGENGGQLVVTAIDYCSASIFSEFVQLSCVHRKELDKTKCPHFRKLNTTRLTSNCFRVLRSDLRVRVLMVVTCIPCCRMLNIQKKKLDW